MTRQPPLADALAAMTAAEVIEVLDAHWFQLSKEERDAYTHVLLEHPERVAIFDDIFRRAHAFTTASERRRN